MATDDLQRLVSGVASAPATFTIPGNGQMRPKAIFAHYDGSGAGGSYLAALKVTSDAGKLIGIYPVVTTTAAGASADVSWFPGVAQSVSAAKVAVVGARIEMHAPQSINNSTDTDLVYDTVAFDTSGMVNLAANPKKLTVTVGGLYLVICERAWVPNASGRRLVGILLNGLVASGGSYNSDNAQIGLSGGGQTTNLAVALIQAAAGDFFATGCNQDSGIGLTSGGGSAEFFSATLTGAL